MKIGMKEEMGIADEMTSSDFGSRARTARNCAWSAHSELCEHRYLARSNGEQ